ncbi:MAG: energy transducer TonB [Novosphingobium sp.]|nr:energy transducer TonB [Novosphingobium sp.]
MAYINMERNRATTLVAVGALHVGVIYALVVGLAGPVWKMIESQPFVGEQIPLPKPPPVVIDTPQPQPDPHPRTREVQIDGRQVVDVKQLADDTKEIRLPPIARGGAGDQVDPPLPPVPPVRSITPASVAPRGSPGTWVTSNDYPAGDLRAGHAGVTRFRLTIGTDGKVAACDVIASSGYPSLDRVACTNLRKRAKFAPATDSTGAAASGSYTNVVRWTIPKDY